MGFKCGAAVNAGQWNCPTSLWEATNEVGMHCYAYGGPGDPCSLHNNNDVNDGMTKDPSACTSDTFYLWDEPDTQGYDYAWAAYMWLEYTRKYASQITAMRARGIKFTSPLVKADEIQANLDAFFGACGPACTDPSSLSYIDVAAVNPFCGAWNGESCHGAVAWVLEQLQSKATRGLPVYVTNWSYLGSNASVTQLLAMEATAGFFAPGSPVHRVYWFGARDYGGGTTKNMLTDYIDSGAHAGETLGQLWQQTCAAL